MVLCGGIVFLFVCFCVSTLVFIPRDIVSAFEIAVVVANNVQVTLKP